jgi:tetratricopeptide (TPR) repeat protein
MRKDYSTVLALTATTGDEPADAWLDCDRGAALVALNRTDEALAAYRRAEVRFDRNRDSDGARKAMWGEARAFAEVGRCGEARSSFRRYEAASRNVRPVDAQLAASYAGLCVDRSTR